MPVRCRRDRDGARSPSPEGEGGASAPGGAHEPTADTRPRCTSLVTIGPECYRLTGVQRSGLPEPSPGLTATLSLGRGKAGGLNPHFSQTFVVRRRRVAWMRGARRFCDEGIVDTMSRSEIAVQRSRQAAIRRLAAKVCEKCGLRLRSWCGWRTATEESAKPLTCGWFRWCRRRGVRNCYGAISPLTDRHSSTAARRCDLSP